MQGINSATNKTRRLVGSVLIYLTGFVLIGSAASKFAHVPKVVSELSAMGFEGNRLMMIAALEAVSALLFLIQRIRSAGLLLVSAYMGGAIATHVGHGQSALQPAFFLLLLWLGVWLRDPEVLRNVSHQERGLDRTAQISHHGFELLSNQRSYRRHSNETLMAFGSLAWAACALGGDGYLHSDRLQFPH